MKLHDLLGRRFERLTVVDRENIVRADGKRRGRWVCQCDCGGKQLAGSCDLLAGRTRAGSKSQGKYNYHKRRGDDVRS